MGESHFFKSKQTLNHTMIDEISTQKNEPAWMNKIRHDALDIFFAKALPEWGADLSSLPLDDICYYLKPIPEQLHTWDDVPDNIKTTFEKLGIPQAERTLLAGVGAQYESEMIYKRLKQEWIDKGVLFTDMEEAVQKYPDVVKNYFASIIPAHDNKFAALNTAVWSGGSFVYVPEGVHITLPLQAYFRINAPSMGQFERTLIIAERGSFVHYVEGCSAPVYRSGSLHSAVVELIALPEAHIRYTTIQNWSENVYNLVTKRAIAHEKATVEWIDGNFGSKVTMKYPCVVLQGKGSKATVISIALAKDGQHQDTGAKVIHLAPKTTSNIIAKSISKGTGRSSYRGLVRIGKRATDARSKVQCDALLLDTTARSDTYPTIISNQSNASLDHEASVSKLDEHQLFYLQLRGFEPQKARSLIVHGFIDIFTHQLPMEYAVEINRLIDAELEGSIG